MLLTYMTTFVLSYLLYKIYFKGQKISKKASRRCDMFTNCVNGDKQLVGADSRRI